MALAHVTPPHLSGGKATGMLEPIYLGSSRRAPKGRASQYATFFTRVLCSVLSRGMYYSSRVVCELARVSSSRPTSPYTVSCEVSPSISATLGRSRVAYSFCKAGAESPSISRHLQPQRCPVCPDTLAASTLSFHRSHNWKPGVPEFHFKPSALPLVESCCALSCDQKLQVQANG